MCVLFLQFQRSSRPDASEVGLDFVPMKQAMASLVFLFFSHNVAALFGVCRGVCRGIARR